MKNLVLYGAGGDDINQIKPLYKPIGFIVDEKFYRKGQIVKGLPIIGTMDWIEANANSISCICTIGTAVARKKIYQDLKNMRVDIATLIHPTTFVDKTATVGCGSIIARSCSIGSDAIIGEGVFIDGMTSIGHDVKIGNYSVIFPRGQLSGYSSVGECCEVGGMTFLAPHKHMRDYSKSASGSIIFTNVPEGRIVMGNPAHKIDI